MRQQQFSKFIFATPVQRVWLLALFALLCPTPHGRAEEATAWTNLTRIERRKLYQPIEDGRVRSNVEYAFSRARQQLGPPRIPVRTFYLRLSAPLNEGSPLPSDFNKTSLDDEASGTFTIYVQPRGGEMLVQFMPLYHEVCHLLNARLLDVYVEGLNDAFAKRHFRHLGWSWERFKPVVEDTDDLSGLSLRMMDEVWAVAGEADIRRFLSYAVPTADRPPWMHIDVNAWLSSLRPAKRVKVAAIMLRYAPALEEHRADYYGIRLSLEWPRPEMVELKSYVP